nr:MAG: major coat protein [Hubei polero-like virus 2]UVK78433.1 MAG: major coat protein [Hubei polero-like virus 2]
MNTGGARRRGRNGKRTRPGRARRNPVRPIVMVAPTRTTRRNRRRSTRSNRGRSQLRNAGGTSNSETFVFNKDSLKGNSKGTITFGPSLSESVALSGGVLKAYHEYKITKVNVRFFSESASTAEGSIAYEVDPHCKLTELGSTLRKFTITKAGQATFGASKINGLEWHDSSEDQFKIHYKGNGSTTTAGYFQIRYWVSLHNPK